MKPRLYIETTIPSYLMARRSRDLRLAADQETTQEWWELRRQEFDLFVSEGARILRTDFSRFDALNQGAPAHGFKAFLDLAFPSG